MARIGVVLFALMFISVHFAHAHSTGGFPGANFVHVKATTKKDRTELNNIGMSIDAVVSDAVYGTVNDATLELIKKSKFKIIETFKIDTGKAKISSFPPGDEPYHDYAELSAALQALADKHPDFVKLLSIGRTVEGREIWCVRFNTSKEVMESDDAAELSGKPGVLFVGNHHAREHLSAEVPLMLAQYLASNYGTDAGITELINTRDIMIVPMLNPDGVEFDINKQPGRYQMHRKNMRDPRGQRSIDLNRNYGYKWGGDGASDNPNSETYRGPEAFSEPETQALRDFVSVMPNLKMLLSFHTFSELILYPWGYTDDPICRDDCGDEKKRMDQLALVAMARQMARWNKYTAKQASGLYIVSGDTIDWAYGTYGILGYTFELSPKWAWGGSGFYPGADIIQKVFEDNLNPALHMINLAADPYRSIETEWPGGVVSDEDLYGDYDPNDFNDDWLFRMKR
ncbi:MAG TPA: M14 family metallopeptidase [Oligoflexia bacterium]|nr:M14 family metallopeptidase [Oligoflexia bacterium]